ncbi:MAG TPA: helix-hairpin-helix domain-containing protein [Anaerolineaceae bacterium]|nr:helix-hairpin-helix domain-containing protein [Anaerolineaceae bacterium]
MKYPNFVWFLFAVLSGFLFAGIVILMINHEVSDPITLIPVPTPEPIKVYLSGNVNNPGIYELEIDSRLEDLFVLAKVDLDSTSHLNLASKLYDGQHIILDNDGYTKFNELVISSDNMININEANMEQLVSLPGIGEVKAKEIILYRETYGYFDRIEDILNVPGIGETTFKQFKDKIVINSVN